MNCKCGARAFYFEKVSREGRYGIYKCDPKENKKKARCDLYHTISFNKPGTSETEKKIFKTENSNSNSNSNIKYSDHAEVKKFIHLYKITGHLPENYSDMYISNINYILKRMNMDLFFRHSEKIEDLEERIKQNIQTNVKSHDNNLKFPIKMAVLPTGLDVPKETKIKKIKTKNKKFKNLNGKSYINIKKIEEYEKIEEEKEIKPCNELPSNTDLMSESDSDSDESPDKDNTFDVESDNSEPEDNDIDESGAFSD
tara:strand:+ start:502 stop:1266 length:765 start_codon:yes stop_codon:yes gene_type:complete